MIRVLEMFGEPITYGGQESVVYNMLTTFDLKNEFNVDLFTPYFADNEKLIKLINDNNGTIYSLGIKFENGDNRFKLYKPVLKFLNTHRNYDVVHIHTGSLTTMVVYSMVAKKCWIKKVIVHSHSGIYKDNFVKKLRRHILNIPLKMFADVFLGCSDNANYAKYTGSNLKNAIVVNNGINVDIYKYNGNYRKEIRDDFGVKENEFLIGSLGRLTFEKNTKFIIGIYNELLINHNNIKLMIVGDGDESKNIKDYAKSLGIYDKIIFTGYRTDSYKFYQAFDIFLLPSLYEGMPVACIEAQISGLPTLISNKVDKICCISNNTKFLSIVNTKIWEDEINKLIINLCERNGNANLIDFDRYDYHKSYEIIKSVYNNVTVPFIIS